MSRPPSDFGTLKFSGEDAIPVMDRKSARVVCRKCLPDLQQRPFRRRVLGHVLMDNQELRIATLFLVESTSWGEIRRGGDSHLHGGAVFEVYLQLDEGK